MRMNRKVEYENLWSLVAAGNCQVDEAIPSPFRRLAFGLRQQVERGEAFRAGLASAFLDGEYLVERAAMASVALSAAAPPADGLHSGIVCRFSDDGDFQRTRLHRKLKHGGISFSWGEN